MTNRGNSISVIVDIIVCGFFKYYQQNSQPKGEIVVARRKLGCWNSKQNIIHSKFDN